MIQHSLHKQSLGFLFFFFLKQKKVISPKVIYGEQPHGCGCHFTRSSELGELAAVPRLEKIPQREEKLISRVLLIFLLVLTPSWRLLWTNRKSSLQGVLGSSDVIRKKSPPSWTPPSVFRLCQDNTFLIIVWNPEKACSHCFQNMGTKAGIKWWLSNFSGVILSHTRLSIASPFPRKSGKSRDSPLSF